MFEFFKKWKKCRELEKQIELLDREVNALRTSNRLYELESYNDSRDREHLREEVERLEGLKIELGYEVNRLKADYDDLSTDYIALEKAQGELAKAHDEVLAKNLRLESRNEFLEKENEALHERVDAHWSLICKIVKEHPEYFPEVASNE